LTGQDFKPERASIVLNCQTRRGDENQPTKAEQADSHWIDLLG
jgi:hypothetical protein